MNPDESSRSKIEQRALAALERETGASKGEIVAKSSEVIRHEGVGALCGQLVFRLERASRADRRSRLVHDRRSAETELLEEWNRTHADGSFASEIMAAACGEGSADAKIRHVRRISPISWTERCSSCQGRGEFGCNTCGGRGSETCGYCRGAGSIQCPLCAGTRITATVHGNIPCNACFQQGRQVCPNCQGHRVAYCPTCQGRKRLYCRDCKGKKEREVAAGMAVSAELQVNMSRSPDFRPELRALLGVSPLPAGAAVAQTARSSVAFRPAKKEQREASITIPVAYTLDTLIGEYEFRGRSFEAHFVPATGAVQVPEFLRIDQVRFSRAKALAAALRYVLVSLVLGAAFQALVHVVHLRVRDPSWSMPWAELVVGAVVIHLGWRDGRKRAFAAAARRLGVILGSKARVPVSTRLPRPRLIVSAILAMLTLFPAEFLAAELVSSEKQQAKGPWREYLLEQMDR